MALDPDDFDQALCAHHGPLRSYLAGMGIPAHAVDDVAQEVFLAYYRKPEARPTDVETVRWLKGIARNQAIDWFRRNAGSKQRLALCELVSAHTPADGDEPEDDLRLDALRACLDRVSGGSRTLLDAHYRDDESADAIARQRGVGASAIRMALLRLREQLRTCVERRIAGETIP